MSGGMVRTSPARTTISLPSIQNLSAPSRIYVTCSLMWLCSGTMHPFHKDAGHHDVASDHKLPAEERVQFLEFDRVPGNVFQLRFGAPLGETLLTESAALSSQRH